MKLKTGKVKFFKAHNLPDCTDKEKLFNECRAIYFDEYKSVELDEVESIISVSLKDFIEGTRYNPTDIELSKRNISRVRKFFQERVEKGMLIHEDVFTVTNFLTLSFYYNIITGKSMAEILLPQK